MKILLLSLFAVLAVYTASAVPISDVPEPQYSRFIQYTDENGLQKFIDLEEQPDRDLVDEIEDDPESNMYFLFTRKNPTVGQELVMDDAESVSSSNFDPLLPIVVIAHGWLGNQESGMNSQLRDVFLEKEDVNFIVLDWTKMAAWNYVSASAAAPIAGRKLGKFLAFLESTTGASYDNMHLVGFSLGAHLVGNAGRELNGKVARVTGLDPSGPLWNINSNKISSDNAKYVEGIHTDGGLSVSLGIGYAIGDADFFPNGGNSQPGCFTSLCHHNRSWRLFAASVAHDHLVGTECSNYLQVTLNFCRGDKLNMGNNDLKKTGSGLYHVSTRRRYPF